MPDKKRGSCSNPNTFPDITLNTSSPVPVVIRIHNIPTTATLTLTILDENNVPDTVVQAPPLSNCTASDACTTTVNVTFPFGGSFGLTKVTIEGKLQRLTHGFYDTAPAISRSRDHLYFSRNEADGATLEQYWRDWQIVRGFHIWKQEFRQRSHRSVKN